MVGETDRLTKASKVAELLTTKYYRSTVHPYLLKYKNTVLSILIEEENEDGLEDLFNFLEITLEDPGEILDESSDEISDEIFH